ncbi:MAG: FAD-dependent oxidoreductase [Pseudomonadota bacterium]|nr:FAD-dependent oxidoreductase [Pseudomonadota bacterium]
MSKVSLMRKKKLKIAVIGSGIAGLSASWLLSRSHNVALYEKDSRLGGHSNTIDVRVDDKIVPVDTGFIVYNETNYPNLVKLFDFLSVPTQPTSMSFAVSFDGGSFEWGSQNLNTLFGQRKNIFDVKFWTMIGEIRRFFSGAERFLEKLPSADELTLASLLEEMKLGKYFIKNFILPMGAAIWSSSRQDILDQPATTFISFFSSHGLLRLQNRLPWRTVSGGSKQYVRKFSEILGSAIRLSCGVDQIKRYSNYVEIRDDKGKLGHYDAVVLATHADQALDLLVDPDKEEKNILQAFRYKKNQVVLHSDPRLMPQRKRMWSSWNFMGDQNSTSCVTYWMNLLQSIDQRLPLFVTVNPSVEPGDTLVHQTFVYDHPQFDLRAWRAQRQLWSLQGKRNTWYCGSYFGHGFHEDALQSGLAAAESLGGKKRPWKIGRDSDRIYRQLEFG